LFMQPTLRVLSLILARQGVSLIPEPRQLYCSLTALMGWDFIRYLVSFAYLRGFSKIFVFVHIGCVDSRTFKGPADVGHLQNQVKSELDRYVDFMRRHGHYAEGFYSIGIDIVDEITQITPKILERFPNSVFFGGQLVFPEDSFPSRWLHNYIVFAVQRRFYREGIPFVILPI
jgi:hypothetical protein